MSIESQKKFLAKFDKRLEKEVKEYRREKANRQTHLFYVSDKTLRKGIRDALVKEMSGDDNGQKNIKKVLDKVKTKPVILAISQEVSRKITNDSVVQGKVLQNTQTVFFALFSATKGENGRYRNIYKQVYKSYDTILNNFAETVHEISVEVLGKSAGSKAKNYWALSHDENEGIAESTVKDSLLDALEDTDIKYDDAVEWLKNSGVQIEIVRNTKTNRMFVLIGSVVQNYEDGKSTRQKKADLQKIVKGASKLANEMGEEIIGLKGSDSFYDIKRKKLIEKVVKEFEKAPNVEVVAKENTKVKKTKTKVKDSKQRKQAISTRSNLTKSGVVANRARKVKKGVASSPLKLLALINQKLPKVVAKNMGDPALNYRTGRFASSARATDVAMTAKGFPSIGYTYQKSPYSVFESTSGSRFSSVDRDPRILIDRSMREIAQELAIGRFYTRRV